MILVSDGIPHPAPAYRTLVRTPSCSKSASRATTRSAASYSGGNPSGSGAPAREGAFVSLAVTHAAELRRARLSGQAAAAHVAHGTGGDN